MARYLSIVSAALCLILACAATYELCSGNMLSNQHTALYQLR